MSDIAVRVEDLGKQYRLGERAHYRTVREKFSAVDQDGRRSEETEFLGLLRSSNQP